MVAGRRQRLEVMRERVETRGCGEPRRQRNMQLRIDDRDFGEEERGKDHDLGAGLFVYDDGGPSHLGAGARGRGNADHRGDVISDPVASSVGVVVVHDRRCVRRHQRDPFGGIQG